MSTVALFLLAACCHRQATDANLIGKWKALNAPGAIVFDADHTLIEGTNEGNYYGTWIIGDGTLTTTVHEKDSPAEEVVNFYHSPKVCGERLVLGPSIMSIRHYGQVGKPEDFDSGPDYKRVR